MYVKTILALLRIMNLQNKLLTLAKPEARFTLPLVFARKVRVDKPMRRSGKIVSITKKDWSMIQYQIKREYLLTQLR